MATATWTAPRDWADGYVVPASDLQAYLSNNDLYLWTWLTGGIATSIVLPNNTPYQAKDSGAGARWLIGLDGSNNAIIRANGGGFLFQNNAGTQNNFVCDSSGQLFSYGDRLVFSRGAGPAARAHRHFLANDRHMESGSASIAGSATSTFTFARAFGAQPQVVWSEEGASGGGSITSYTTSGPNFTGFIFTTNAGATGTYRWIAEGQSS